jgi:hypothetical protein
MALRSTLLTNVPASIFTSIGSSAITAMYFCNSGNVAVHVSVYAVPNGNIAGVSNAIYYEIPLAVNDTYVIDSEKLILDTGDSIQANILTPNVGTVRVVATVSSIGV